MTRKKHQRNASRDARSEEYNRKREEHLLRLNAARVGKPLPEATRRKLSELQIGHEVSQETRDKISARNRGVPKPQHWISLMKRKGLETFASDVGLPIEQCEGLSDKQRELIRKHHVERKRGTELFERKKKTTQRKNQKRQKSLEQIFPCTAEGREDFKRAIEAAGSASKLATELDFTRQAISLHKKKLES